MHARDFWLGLIVVVSIAGILLGAAPVVQEARQAHARAICSQNIKQGVGLACHAYGHVPPRVESHWDAVQTCLDLVVGRR